MSSSPLRRVLKHALALTTVAVLSSALPSGCASATSSSGGGSTTCLDGGQCPVGQVCSNGVCISGTGGTGGTSGTSDGGGSDAGSCPSGLSWCSGECVDVKKNITHCGACDQPCGAGQSCIDGKCETLCTSDAQCPQPGSCSPVTHKCECSAGHHSCAGQCLSNDSVGSCGTSCTPCPQPTHGSATCDGTSCGVICDAGYHDCSGQCVSNNSTDTCGTSCTPCPSDANTTPTCDGIQCGVTCKSGTHECSGQCVSNTDPQTCGTSCTPCPSAPNATPGCTGLACVIVCNPGYHNCWGDCVSNDSPQNCGTSCVPCPSSNGVATCTNGTCGLTCNAGYHLCSGTCVPDTAPTSCGTSCTPCPTPANSTATCTAGACGFTCNTGFHLCSGACVADDAQNCGPTCTPCPSPPVNQVAQCVNGVCGVIYKTASLSVGTNTSCLVTTAGGAKCWGYNVYGQVGDGTTIARSKPTDVTGLTTNASAIESGVYYHTCALTSTGGVKCWGYNGHGQLGDGTTTTKYIPTDVTGLSSGVTALAAGYYHTCALTSAGGVKCWGYNYYGQLGDGTTTTKYVPTDVPTLTSGVIAIAAGYQHTCALISDGTVKCWGYNGYGQLGDGTTTTKYVPTAVSSITSGATAVTCGYNFTCAIVNGGAKCWGYNSYGNLGDGTTKAQYVPTDVSGLATGVTWIDAGSYHACAIGAGAALSCWGQNTYGQLGDGTTVTKYVPTPVVALTSGISKVACGSNHTCALTSGGLVKCWGQNSYGQLGDNTTTSKSTPVDIVP